MKNYILNKIFLEAQDDIKIADNEYLSAKRKSYELEKELLKELTDNQKDRLKKLIDALADIAFFECKYNFFYGIKISANLIFEMFSE